MAWNYADEESLIEHIRKLNKKHEKEMVEEMESAFKGHEDDVMEKVKEAWNEVLDEDEEDEEQEYETYVKYIVTYRSTKLERDFEALETKVNKFIESQSDSFILEGPIQIESNYLVQTLINEDEM